MPTRMPNFQQYLKTKQKWVLCAALFFLVGFLAGILLPSLLDADFLASLHDSLAQLVAVIPASEVDGVAQVTSTFFQYGASLLVFYLLGYFALGLPFIAVLVAFIGCQLGFTLAMLFSGNAAQGIVLLLLSILPPQLILIPVVILAAAMAGEFSFFLARGSNIWGRPCIEFSISFMVLSLITLCGSLVQGYVSPALLQLFFRLIQ